MGSPENPVETLVGQRATVAELLQARVTRSDDALFLSWEDARFTYRECWAHVGDVAAWLHENLTQVDGGRVASFLRNRPEAIWAWLGTLVAGATYVPLNREHRGKLLADMVARSRAEILITDLDGARDLPDLRGTGVNTLLLVENVLCARDDVARVASWSELDDGGTGFVPPARAPSAVAEIMYTSGTTGRSKAVQITHNQLCRGAGWVAWSLELTDADVIHGWMPLYHIAAQLDSALAMIVAGGRVALFPTFSRSRFWSQVEANRATVFIGMSNIFKLIWDLPPKLDDATSTLRAGIMGGIPSDLHRAFEERFAVRLVESYGMTEAEPVVLAAPGDRFPPGTMGRATPDFEVAVVDDLDRPVAPGQTGEIACRPRVPDVMTPGYEGDDAATLAAIRNCWFHTGDIGRMDADGYVGFVDRKKHAIRRRGENISSWELESLISDHPAVAECCALGVPSPLGEDDVKVVVVPVAGEAVEPDEFRTWCEERMARFMLPRYVEVRDELPRNSVGKVRKEELRRIGDVVWDAESLRTDRNYDRLGGGR